MKPSNLLRLVWVSTKLLMFKLLRSSASVLSRSCSSRKLSSYAAPLLVTPEQVIELTRSNPSAVSVIDSSWFIPGFWRDARAEFLAKRIPGAQYLDLDQVASPNKLGLTHMMPTPQIFASACGMHSTTFIPL